MAISLKAYIPRLAQIVGLTPAALYERQRALVREGLLIAETGRGPGSGVRITEDSVALLLIAVLATDSLSEVGKCTREIAKAKSQKPCKLTGKLIFKDALAEILSNNFLSRRVDDVLVCRTQKTAVAAAIEFDERPVADQDVGPRDQTVYLTGRKLPNMGQINIEARMSGLLINRIQDDMGSARLAALKFFDETR